MAGADALDITVLLGGPGDEREVSLATGAAISDALERLGHRVCRSDISPQDVSALDRDGIDLVFIALHGEFGEDGQVQELCEARGLRYVGSGPLASRLAMDKAASKQLFKRAGLQTPDWMVIEEFHEPRQVQAWFEDIQPPVVIKPVSGGSSVDVVICPDAATRDAALDVIVDKYGRGMLERFVPGREFTVGIVGEQALPVLQIVPDGVFYDYRAKYSEDAATQYVFEVDLSAQECSEMQAAALAAHWCLDCQDLSRVDFIVDESGCPQIIELNTIPGFTSHSLLPKAAARAGMSFDQLVARLVALAMDRSGARDTQFQRCTNVTEDERQS